jgi:hypothetical protein
MVDFLLEIVTLHPDFDARANSTKPRVLCRRNFVACRENMKHLPEEDIIKSSHSP